MIGRGVLIFLDDQRGCPPEYRMEPERVIRAFRVRTQPKGGRGNARPRYCKCGTKLGKRAKRCMPCALKARRKPVYYCDCGGLASARYPKCRECRKSEDAKLLQSAREAFLRGAPKELSRPERRAVDGCIAYPDKTIGVLARKLHCGVVQLREALKSAMERA